mgnify:CR=1 FL=1
MLKINTEFARHEENRLINIWFEIDNKYYTGHAVFEGPGKWYIVYETKRIERSEIAEQSDVRNFDDWCASHFRREARINEKN